MAVIDPSFHMWVTFAVVIGALAAFAMERAAIEVVSLAVVCVLLAFFHAVPLTDAAGAVRLEPVRLLGGFANPALITVVALLVMGRGIARTGVLDRGADWVSTLGGRRAWVSVVLALVVVLAVSAFLNNIPVVVIFIPFMQTLAERIGDPASKVMIPLSYAAILGGMTTLIGSSTNLLVNGALVEMDEAPFTFFGFAVPGLVLACVGLAYVIGVAPRLLKDRGSLADTLVDRGGTQFIAQITVSEESDLVGERAPGGVFPKLMDMTVRLIQRDEETFLPPFEGYEVRPGDELVVAASRTALTEATSRDPGLLYPDLRDGDRSRDEHDPRWESGERVLAELMVAPASPMIGQRLRQVGFRYATHCIVLGIRRRARMYRARMTEIRLEAGDVLLVLGRRDDVDALKANPDVVLIAWSATDLPTLSHAWRAIAIFVVTIGLAASGMVPIVVATLTGALAMVVSGVLSAREGIRAIDAKVAMTIVAALALGVALLETGGAAFLARLLVEALGDAGPAKVLSFFFLLVAALANVISTKTCAVLFTPIGVDIAVQLGVSPEAFAVAVIFAANCSFASPLGYQTNLLVMAPGRYRFTDFARAGLPLIVVLWIAFSLFAPWYYGL